MAESMRAQGSRVAHAFSGRIAAPGHDAAVIAPSADGWRLTGFASYPENGQTRLRYEVDLASDSSTRSDRIEGFRNSRLLLHSFRRDASG